MNEKTTIKTGNKYHDDLTFGDIAKGVRSDIKAAIKDGFLPKGTKVSVRQHKYSMGRTLYVTLEKLPGVVPISWQWFFAQRELVGESFRFSNEGRTIKDTLEKIVCAYRFSHEHALSDYHRTNFYYDISMASIERFWMNQMETIGPESDWKSTFIPPTYPETVTTEMRGPKTKGEVIAFPGYSI